MSANFGKSLHMFIFLGREGLYLLLTSQKASDPTKILNPLAWTAFENSALVSRRRNADISVRTECGGLDSQGETSRRYLGCSWGGVPHGGE